MIGQNDLPPGYQPDAVSGATLKTLEFVAMLAICIMTLGPLAVTAYQNPYTGKISATPNLPNAN